MTRKIIIALLVTLALGSVNFADAQQPKKLHRIGYLSPFDPAGDATRSDAIRLALREIGYIEGQNIAIEYRYARQADRPDDSAKCAGASGQSHSLAVRRKA
jgi:putative tryptophan/tyrosine transport system substrate-binding protein